MHEPLIRNDVDYYYLYIYDDRLLYLLKRCRTYHEWDTIIIITYTWSNQTVNHGLLLVPVFSRSLMLLIMHSETEKREVCCLKVISWLEIVPLQEASLLNHLKISRHKQKKKDENISAIII